MRKQLHAAPSFQAGHLAVHIHDHPAEVQFSFERQDTRLASSVGISVVTHVVTFLLALFVVSLLPEPEPIKIPPRTNKDIVWLAQPGPGGGGGGGGNRSPLPPQQAQLPGRQKITVPVEKPTTPTPKEKEEAPQPEQHLIIPAKTLASAEQALPGVLSGLPVLSSLGSGTGGGGGSGTGTGIGEGTGPGLGPGWGGGTGGGAYRPGNGVSEPRLLKEVKPQYTPDAMRAKVQGVVLLECIVNPDGTVGEITVVKSLDPVFGLDQEAIKAARQWRFVPGMKGGQAVPVVVLIQMEFTLR